jgi:hypothetical protein
VTQHHSGHWGKPFCKRAKKASHTFNAYTRQRPCVVTSGSGLAIRGEVSGIPPYHDMSFRGKESKRGRNPLVKIFQPMYSPRRVVPEGGKATTHHGVDCARIFRTEASTAVSSLSIISLACFFFSALLPLSNMGQPHDHLRGHSSCSSPHFTPDKGSPASEAQEPDGS